MIQRIQRKGKERSGLGPRHSLHLDVIGVGGSSRSHSRQGLVRSKSPDSNSLGNDSISEHDNEDNEDDVDDKHQIEDCDGPELGVVQIALGGAVDAADNVEKLVASFRYEGIDVEREAGLKHPESLKAEGSPKGEVGDEEPGVAGEGEAEEGGEGGDAGGDGVALGLEIGGLEGGGGGGDGVLEEEDGGGEAEEEIGGEGEEGGGVGDEEREGEDEKEEEDAGGLEGGEAVDGGAALEEWVGVRGD